MVCLGRLPWQAIGMNISAPSQNDVSGLMPWYAVSANLTDPTCLNVINPSILSMAYTSYVCGGSTLPHPWLTVRDNKGNILSDRVAVILFLPGLALEGQSRPESSLADITSYLESITVPNTCASPCAPGTYSNADTDNDFIMGGGLTGASSSSNDRLIYITIDELMVELVKRAAVEADSLIAQYEAKNGHYPYAAPLGSAPDNHISSGTSNSGMIPIDVTDTCSCASETSCACSFNPITAVAFRKSTVTWSSLNTFGACSVTSSTTCTCTGAGFCFNSGLTAYFWCNANGTCSTNVTGGRHTYTFPTYADTKSLMAFCTQSGSSVRCEGGAGSFSIGLKENSWFKDNYWQDYFYYAWSSTSNIQLGGKPNLSAILIGAGDVITTPPYAAKGASQVRPSSNLNDYLDSAENLDGDFVYDSTQASRNSTYNDQSFIIAP